ncbi:hypothetical protein HDV00_008341 [Rhizophlyctis rosea]|nr:hypothetical protein HDV00_008341 [Rhizophlyctis rosea]
MSLSCGGNKPNFYNKPQPTPYWMYEFCYNRHVRQFHIMTEQEKAAKQKPQDYYLGKYGVPVDRPSTSHSSTTKDEKTKDMSKDVEIVTANQDDKTYAFLRHEWGGGTGCDVLGGRPRSITVEYLCTNPQYIDHIINFQETGTCRYHIQIHSSDMCRDTVFVPRQAAEHQTIQCAEVVGDDVAVRGGGNVPWGGAGAGAALKSLPQALSAKVGAGGKGGKGMGTKQKKVVVQEVRVINPLARDGQGQTVLIKRGEKGGWVKKGAGGEEEDREETR